MVILGQGPFLVNSIVKGFIFPHLFTQLLVWFLYFRSLIEVQVTSFLPSSPSLSLEYWFHMSSLLGIEITS